MNKAKNFICISSFNDDLEWFRELDYPHIIFDKCCKGVKKSKYFPHEIAPSNLKKKYPDMNITSGELGGYNINEYLSYIISNYNNLPDFIAFIKGNIVKRHVSFDYLKRILNNKHFTSIEEWQNIDKNGFNFLKKSSYISKEGGWLELNNNWYANKEKHPNKFFNNFNTFMNFIFKFYENKKYIRFCPGANYILPRQNILKYDLVFYQNLKYIINYSQLSGESHILERALLTIWNSEYETSEIMKKPFDKNTVFPKKDNLLKSNFLKLISRF